MKHYKIVLLISLLGLSLSAADLKWETDLPKAQAQAQKENKMVLMDFTGSDWCGWCKKLKQEVFDQKAFIEYAQKNLVLVEVDFPRRKQLSDEQKQANRALGTKYGANGFPTIVVLNSSGKEVWKQVGYMPGGPDAWIGKLNDAKKK